MGKNNIVFTGGGTAGHVMPCAALIEELKSDFNIHYIGSKDGMEKGIVTAIEGVTYHAITTVKLRRSLSIKNLAIPFKLLMGIIQARKLMKKLKPAAVFSKGGFVALPVTIAARCPVICHESDMSIGLANKLARRKAVYFCTSFEQTAEGLKNGVFTGLPLRKSLFVPKTVTTGRPRLLIMGGSLGAKAINDCVAEGFGELTRRYEVTHITGKGKALDLKGAHYRQLEFCPYIAQLYSAADVVVSRGGSTALFELIALKIPSLIIPLPKGESRGDQIQNAEYFGSRGLCRVLDESALSAESLLREIDACLKDSALKTALNEAQNIDGRKKVLGLIKAAANN